ncbi:hypothetical protein ABKN59_005881 [Abortiporus biennis]
MSSSSRILEIQLDHQTKLAQLAQDALKNAFGRIKGQNSTPQEEKYSGDACALCGSRNAATLISGRDATSLKLDQVTAELNELRIQYSQLQREKEEAEIRHKEDYQKWRKFKRWFTDHKRQRGARSRIGSDSKQKRERDLVSDVDSAEDTTMDNPNVDSFPVTPVQGLSKMSLVDATATSPRHSDDVAGGSILPPATNRSDQYSGPQLLPQRLQPPMWNSQTNNGYVPPKSKHKATHLPQQNKWVPAETPPGYWDIGFPDTQEAQNINNRAKLIHDRVYNS